MRALPAMFAIACAVLSGCMTKRTPPPGTSVSVAPVEEGLPTAWRQVATAADIMRIDALGAAWTHGLAVARPGELAREAALLDPKSALTKPAPSPGAYRCRMIKLGASGRRALQAFKPFFCFVGAEGALLTFAKASGTQRPAGRLWDDGDKRLVFLGAMALSPDAPPPAYGADVRRNRVGVVERIGDFRWRMTLLPQGGDAALDVIELVPNTPPPSAS
ncbi:MAG: DUF4893 domain-containing protein [Sphingomonadaceae bacterium]|nr:DUF4893 domain-containing protein [Sphingomonadaceae bacterium]